MSVTDNKSSSAPSVEGIPTRSVSVAEVHDFAKAIGLSHAAPGRCSTVLLFELYCRAAMPLEALNPAKIVAEVRALEGLGPPVGTASEDQFDDPNPHGLWKKHYLEDGLRSFARNIVLGFGKKGRGLRRIIEAHHTPTTAGLSPEAVSGNIADAVINVYAERSRSQNLTGEWIVFAKHEGLNYYLSLATHDEVRPNPNEFYERIKRGCSGEFPFLF